MLILCCLAAGALAVLHLIIGYFWDKKWLGLLPILSYLCCAVGMMTCFYDVARRAQSGDISGLLALLVRGKGTLYRGGERL